MKQTLVRMLGVVAMATFGLVVMAVAASAQPVSLTACGSLSTGNYVVTKNIAATGNCFVITANNVAIDFKGHTISGNGTGSAVFDSGAHSYIALSNGKIKNFATGISLGGCCHGINNMNVSGNSGDGIAIDQCCSVLNNVKTNGNGGDGIDIATDDNVISGAQAKNNGGVGIFNGSCCDFVDHAVVTNNGGAGIELLGCCSSVVQSTVKGNGADGVDMNDCCNAVTLSTASNNSGNGLTLGDDDNYVSRSTMNGNGGIGAEFPSSNDQVVMNSTANGNTTGVELNCPSVVMRLSAKKNSSGNLSESGSTCTNLNNNAP